MVAFNAHERPAHNAAELPVTPPPRLIGRESELQQIYPPLRESRAVFLHGPDGVGKSAVAAMLAAAFAKQPGGSLWLYVDDDTTLESLIVRVGRAYDVAEVALSDNPLGMVGAVAALLQQHKPLIVLDGPLETSIAAKFVTRCADRVPVLLIERETQNGPWVTVPIAPLTPDAAVELFKQEANIAKNAPNAADADLRALVKALGHLPFAICVAARTMLAGKMSPSDFLNRVRQVAPSVNNDPARIALALSFAALNNNPLQGVLLMMGAIPSGAGTADLLGMISGAPAASINQAVQMLAGLRLVDRSTRGDQVYFRQHALTHKFCEERLRSSARLDGLQEKSREKLVEYAQANKDASQASRLAAEMENFVALARHAQRTGDRDTNTKLVIALSQAGTFVNDHGFVYELVQIRGAGSAPFPAYQDAEPAAPSGLFASLTAAPVEEFAPEELEAAARGDVDDEDDEEFDDEDEAEEVVAPASLATAAPPELDEEYLIDDDEEEADSGPVPVAQSPEDFLSSMASAPPTIAEPRTSAMFGDEDLDDEIEDSEPVVEEEPATVEEKIATLRSQLGQARQDGDMARQVTLLRQLGHWEVEEGLLIEAIATYNQALAVYEQRDDQKGQLETLEILSALMEKTENAQASVLMAQRGVAIAEAMGDEETRLQLLLTLGDARQQLGESAEAARSYGQALQIARTTDDSTHEAIILQKLGTAQLDSGDPDRAIDSWEQALALFKAQERRADEGRVKGALGQAYGELQRWPEAINFHKSALYIARELGDKAEEAVQLSDLGYTCLQAEQLGEAMMHYRQALHLAFEYGNRADIVAALVDLARLMLRSPTHLKITEQLVADGLQLDPSDKDLRSLKDRIAGEILAAQNRGVQFKQVAGTARQFAAQGYRKFAGA
ncbi:MAG: tetratricopeptide repeat protein [Chloroflexi bacterium]|nr:tetratricopeptide repeat protein [Chloroflexota bacterium]